MSEATTGQTTESMNGNGTADPSSLPPGAERFWGEFSRTRAGRSRAGSADERVNGSHGHGQECLEWCPICRSADLIRTTAPPDVRNQLEAIQHEAFNVMKAFLAAYSEKTAGVWPTPPGRPSGPDREEPEQTGTDIPIE